MAVVVPLAGVLLWQWIEGNQTDQNDPAVAASTAARAAGNNHDSVEVSGRPTEHVHITVAERPRNRSEVIVRGSDGLAVVSDSTKQMNHALQPGSRLNVMERLRLLDTIEAPLSQAEVQGLLDFLRNPELLDTVSEQRRWALQNDIIDLLQRQGVATEELQRVLSEIIQNPERALVERDYALQQLAGSGELEEADIHWEVIEAGEPELASTAMLHMLGQDRYGEGLDAASRQRLETAALTLLREHPSDAASCSTALQVCGRLGVESVRPLATKIARDSTEPLPLRMAAIGALGQLQPDRNSINLLHHLAEVGEPRLASPIAASLKLLKDN